MTTQTESTPATSDPCCAGAGHLLLPHDEALTLAQVFKALSDPTRVRLLRHLADSTEGTVCACHLPEALGITQPTLSFHMGKLHDAGLVEREQRGRWAHWSIRPETLDQVKGFLTLEVVNADCS